MGNAFLPSPLFSQQEDLYYFYIRLLNLELKAEAS